MRVHICFGNDNPMFDMVTRFLDMCGYHRVEDGKGFHVYADTDGRTYECTEVRTDSGVTLGCGDNASLFCAVCARSENGDLYNFFTLDDDIHLYNIGQHMLKGSLMFSLCDDYPISGTTLPTPQHKSTIDEMIPYFTDNPSVKWVTDAVKAYDAGIYKKAIDGRTGE